MVFIFAIPVFAILVHASIRLRNVKAKLNHQLERIGLKTTLMAQLLEAFSIDIRNN